MNKKTYYSVIIFAVLILATLAITGNSRAADFEFIQPEDLKKLVESGDKGMVVVDVQPAGVYKTGHIKGAVSLPWSPEMTSAGNLPKDKVLILYCDCAHEEDSLDAAGQLRDKWDYTQIKILKGGWTNWMTLGYPTEK